jgi:hypothetical protein
MDDFPGLAVILVVIGMVMFVIDPGTGRMLDLFGSGFLPYRDPGGPTGVQEEDLVPWSWAAPHEPDLADFQEIREGGVFAVTAVEAKSLVPGMARRRE